MKKIWSLTIDDYMEVIKRSKEMGIQPGESMERVFIEYMNEKNKKPIGHTELSQDELLKDSTLKGNKTLSVETKNGKTAFKTIKNGD